MPETWFPAFDFYSQTLSFKVPPILNGFIFELAVPNFQASSFKSEISNFKFEILC